MNPSGVRVERIGDATLYCGAAEDVIPTLDRVSAIITDPPYFRVKDEAWDRQWSSRADFLAWIGSIVTEFERILSPNGSLYMFASPQMAGGVECEIAKRFNVLNHIVWNKAKSRMGVGGTGIDITALRAFWSASKEHVIFAEHYGSDTIAKCDSGWAAKVGELRGFVFAPIREYLAGERDRAGFTTRRIAEEFQKKTGSRTVTGMAGHWFDASSTWQLPTASNYGWLRDLLGVAYLRKEYEDLRKEYEDLRKEYEGLRRPFAVSSDVQWGDVWDFDPVQGFPGKHPCEKPVAMMAHIVRASSRPGDVILDCFAGSGSLGEAALKLGRKVILVERDPHWFEQACKRLERIEATPDLFVARPTKPVQEALL